MEDSRLPKSTAFDAAEKLVTIEVGAEPIRFKVHKSVLCSSSDFFKAGQKPEWSQGRGQVQLLDHSSDAFNIYVNWLYMQKIRTATYTQNYDENEKEWMNLAAAYVLGNELLDTAFKDSVIDALRAKVRSLSGNTIWPYGGELI